MQSTRSRRMSLGFEKPAFISLSSRKIASNNFNVIMASSEKSFNLKNGLRI